MGGFKCVRWFLVSIITQLNSIRKLRNENRVVYDIISMCVVMFMRCSRPL